MSKVGTMSRMPRCVSVSGWSSPARKATRAPRSWPTKAKRSWPSAAARATTSAAMVRLEYTSGLVAAGLSLAPYPRRSGQITVCSCGEPLGDVPPHQMGLGEAVQQHDGAAAAADGGSQFHTGSTRQTDVVEAGDRQSHERPFPGGGGPAKALVRK